MRPRKSCIPSGVRSPAASASCQPFLRSTGARRPRRYASARRRGSTRPNLGPSRPISSSRARAHPFASFTSVMLGTSRRTERPNLGCSTRAKREKVGMPLPTWEGGGIDGWIIFDGPAGAGPGGGGGGRHARGGGPPGRGGAAPRGAAAGRFAVGRATAYRWATAARLEGRRAAKRMGGGPKPRITGEVEAALLDLLREAHHLTLAECRDRLAERTGVRVHPWTVGRALRRCGWT